LFTIYPAPATAGKVLLSVVSVCLFLNNITVVVLNLSEYIGDDSAIIMPISFGMKWSKILIAGRGWSALPAALV